MNPIPDLIQRYIAAQNTHDVDERLLCFALNATVLDEGETIIGKDSIRKWMVETEAKYSQTMKARECREDSGKIILTAETSGTFPGSPIDLDFYFTVNESQISHLEVKVTRKPTIS